MFFGKYIFLSAKTRNLAALIVSVIVATIFWITVDWIWYYESMKDIKINQGRQLFNNLKTVINNTDPGESSVIINNIIYNHEYGLIIVEMYKGVDLEFSLQNSYAVDNSRTQIVLTDSMARNDSIIKFTYQSSNRPPFVVAALRAWSWSIVDYLDNSAKYMEYKLYRRSTPLYAGFLIILLSIYYLFKYWEIVYKYTRANERLVVDQKKQIGMLQDEKITAKKNIEEGKLNLQKALSEKNITEKQKEEIRQDYKKKEDGWIECVNYLESEIKEKNEIIEKASSATKKDLGITIDDIAKGNINIYEAAVSIFGATNAKDTNKFVKYENNEKKLLIRLLGNIYPKLDFSSDSIKQLCKNKSNTKLNKILTYLNQHLMHIEGVRCEPWHGIDGAMEYEFSPAGRVIAYKNGDTVKVEMITFNHAHTK